MSYFFPEHEELDPEAGPGVVTWTDGWHGNFHESVSKFNDQLHDAQREYFDLPRSKERWNKTRRCVPGVGVNLRDAGTLRGELRRQRRGAGPGREGGRQSVLLRLVLRRNG